MGSTGISLYDNYFDDCFAAVYFAPLFQSGKMSASDIIYREGNDFRNLRESSNKLNMSDFASGMAFAGWYSDSDFTMPPTDESNQVYAKFVPVSDVVRLMGGSLNMGAYATGDGEPDYSKTDLRFGFNVDVPNSSSKLDSWRWVTTYEKLDGTRKTLTTDGVNFRAPNDVDAWNGYGTGVVTNLLLTGIGSVAYGTDFTTTLTVTYTTDDGIQVTVSDSPQARSVKEVAELIKSSYDATDEERAYAEGILGAIGA